MSAALLSKLPPSVLERLVPLLPYLRYIPTSIPRSLKWLFLAVLLLNIDGLPGVWHFQIMWPFIRFRIQRALGKKWPNWRVGKDMFEFTTTREFRATPNSSDSFGFHLSNSSYASTLDHVRGPFAIQLVGDAYGIPGMTFALGGTSFDFKKEIPLGAKYEIENRLLGYDKKWLYIQTTFRSPLSPRSTRPPTIYSLTLSRLVIKHNRRTIPPYRAFSLTGYGAEGKENWEVVKGMSKGEKLGWLVGDEEGGKGRGIKCVEVERGMEKRGEWPGQVA
ncbi:hypothetical protein RTG_02877 [Rhodotorula toruloides ATCC 204091]|uniref:Uncharacterized protein n=1 Tax=Rhodotorula toruloides TaxID=5286 RepID=A0A0K3CJQ8_RHOTO|nr:hypothetical protein RTG_02877 [Rhodotorula toruloides ATCC 204091]KAK4335853.1 hypothetical protein RTBOTA2_004609 [Rhodotorula toruloides]PRQ73484.1 hypothetical protein AAT19DRAFT_16237 [Rhodotorula toruloides]